MNKITPSIPSEIRLYRKDELVDKDLLESRDIVLLIEDKHSLLVVYGVHGPEGDRTVPIGDENSIAGDTGCALVAIGERLDV